MTLWMVLLAGVTLLSAACVSAQATVLAFGIPTGSGACMFTDPALPGYRMYVDGLVLCVRRADFQNNFVGYLDTLMSTQWVVHKSCAGQVIFVVENQGTLNAVPIEGVLSHMRMSIGNGTMLYEGKGYSFNTSAAVNFIGDMELFETGYYTGPGRTFEFAVTLECEKIWADEGPTYSGAGNNCPCPTGAVPTYFQLWTPVNGKQFGDAAPENTWIGDLYNASLTQAENNANIKDNTFINIEKDPESSNSSLALDNIGATTCVSRPVAVLHTLNDTKLVPESGHPPYVKNQFWEYQAGNCLRKTWFRTRNVGKNVVVGSVKGPWHAKINTTTNNKLADFNIYFHSGFTTSTVSTGTSEFDITDIGSEMAPVGSANTVSYSYFAIATTCDQACSASLCGEPTITFEALTLVNVVNYSSYAYNGTISGKRRRLLQDVFQPIANLTYYVGGEEGAFCMLPDDTSMTIEWPVGKNQYSAFQTFYGYYIDDENRGGESSATPTPDGETITAESIYYVDTARIRVDGISPRTGGEMKKLTWMVSTGAAGVQPSTLLPDPYFSVPLQCAYIDYSAVGAGESTCPGEPFDMTEAAHPRARGNLHWRLSSLTIRTGTCYPGDVLSGHVADPAETVDPLVPSADKCSSLTSCMQDRVTGEVACTMIGGTTIATESIFSVALFDVGDASTNQTRAYEMITAMVVYLETQPSNKTIIVGVALNSQAPAAASLMGDGVFVKKNFLIGLLPGSDYGESKQIVLTNNMSYGVGWVKGRANAGTSGNLCRLQPVWIEPTGWIPQEDIGFEGPITGLAFGQACSATGETGGGGPVVPHHVLSIPVAAATRLIAGRGSEGQMARDGIVRGALRDASYLGSTRHVRRLFSDCYGSEETAVAAAAVRVAAAAVDGVSLPVCLAMNLVRFVHDVSGRDRPAGGGVVSASFLNAKPAVGGIGVEPRRGGVLRVLFTVASDAVADTVVRSRRNLRDVDPSAAVFDVLSDREEAQHRALWPAFLAAKAAGKRAQFHRARLVVDGERVPAPAC
ncbi:hypothetical protein FOA52_002073 [Chlamydomonas sp. UWO 241]|nr:hypothetical protein FOA52_002073 [Chlamydomonas sp. UWO 241]